MQLKKINMLFFAGVFLAGGIMFSSSAEAGATAKMLADTCSGCHGTHGNSKGPAMPTIAGMPSEYLQTLMAEYKSGERPSTIMGRIASGYSTEETVQISDYFAKQKWINAVSAPQSRNLTLVNPKLAVKGASLSYQNKCDKCHSNDGMTQDDATPRMAGQWVDYLLFKMQDFKNSDLHVPQPRKMHKLIRTMSAEELEAVSHFYAYQE